eukprot:jgi/Mesvir1/10570/Mv21788-RA.1
MSKARAVTRALVVSTGTNAENQCIGLLRALGLGDTFVTFRAAQPHNVLQGALRVLPAESKLVSLVRGSWLASCVSRISRSGVLGGGLSVENVDASQVVEQARADLATRGPLLVVASGHDAVEFAVQVHRLGNDCTFVVQLQHPRQDVSLFDFVITPYHDVFNVDGTLRYSWPPLFGRPWAPAECAELYLPAPRSHAPPLLLTEGALHRVDEQALADAAALWAERLAALPRPFIFVCVGGPTRHCPYDAQDMAGEVAEGVLGMVALSGGSVLVTGSRRTPPPLMLALSHALGRHPRAALWDGQGPNPYLGALAWCDAVVVSADSVSMVSEACSTGKPVYVAGERFCRPPRFRVPLPLLACRQGDGGLTNGLDTRAARALHGSVDVQGPSCAAATCSHTTRIHLTHRSVPLDRGSKLHTFHVRLRARGATRPLSPWVDARHGWVYPPLNDVALAAEALRFAVMGKGWLIGRPASSKQSSP